MLTLEWNQISKVVTELYEENFGQLCLVRELGSFDVEKTTYDLYCAALHTSLAGVLTENKLTRPGIAKKCKNTFPVTTKELKIGHQGNTEKTHVLHVTEKPLSSVQ